MKALTAIVLIVGLTVSCQVASVQSRSKRDLSGDECKGEANGAYLPYPGDCTKYLICQWFEGTVMNCPSGLHWNQDAKTCDWPTAAGCEGGSNTTPSQSTASTTPSTIETATPSTLPPDTTSSAEPTPTLEDDDDICQGKADGTLSPYPYDCAWYIRCEDEKPLVIQCEDDRLFNAILLICDLPENVDCTASPYPTSSTTTTELTTTPTTPTTIETTVPTTIESTTPTTVPTTVPTTIETTTPTTIESTLPTEPSTLPTPVTPSTLPPDTTSSAEPTPTLEADDDVCQGKEDGTLSPYPYDCAWYIRCEDDKPLVLQCEDDRLFNAILLICDYPENVDCTASPYPTTPTTVPTTTEFTLPTPGTPSTRPPDTTSSVEPTPTLGVDDEICEGKEDGTLSAYPYNCAWYIRCEDDKPLVLQCEDGWLFNSILLICDYPENVDCTASPYPTTPTTVPTTESESTLPTVPSTLPTPGTPSTRPPDTTSSAEPTPTLGVDDEICEGKEDGTLSAYPYDCAWYIRCEDNKPLVLQCEDGWLFNDILLICDYPENVDCTASPYPTSSTTTTELPASTIPTTLPVTLPTPGTPSSSAPTTVATTIPSTTPTEPTSTSPVTLPTPGTPSSSAPTTVATTIPSTTPTEQTSTSPLTLPTPVTPSTTSPNSVPTTEPIPTSSLTTVVPTLPTPDDYICQDQPNNAVLPYPWDCAWYVRCENQKPVLTPCEDGWVYNSVLRICDFPANVECVTTPYPTTSPPPTSSMSTTLDWTSTTNDFSTEQPSTRPPYVGTGICANQELGTRLPYPNRCNLYIVCEETAPQTYDCEAGLEFNAELKICQDPEDAGCSIIKTTTTTTEATTTPAVEVPTGICEGLSIGDLIPYPGICSEYILCELPIPIAQECPGDYEFNADLQLCESQEEAGCSTLNTTTTTAPETTPTPAPQPGFTGICRGQQEGDLIPYPGDCNKYIICENPIPIAQKCGSGQDFNADLGICDDPDEGGCSSGNNSTTEATPTTTLSPGTPGMVGICKGYQEGDLIPYPNKCNKYIRCETPVPIAQSCKAGLHFNEALGICDTAESAGCPGYTTTESPSGSTTVGPTTTPKPPVMTGICRDQEIGDKIPYPKNCSKFIVCDVPVPIAIACESGLHFNAELQVCEDPSSAGCETVPPDTTNVCCGQPSGTLLPYPEDCSQYIQCAYPIPKAFSCDSELHFNALTKKCESADSAACEWNTTTEATTTAKTPLTCETAPDGTHLPIEGDCKKYYECDNGASIPLPCPGNTVYSPDAGTCVAGTTCPT